MCRSRQFQRLKRCMLDACLKFSLTYHMIGGWQSEVIEDLGSGMNYRKPGLNKLLEMILRTESQTMYRVHKIKLDPTQEQANYFARAFGVARFAYNWALAAWKEEYEAGGKPNEAALRKRLNSIKAEQFPWMAEVTKVAPQNAIKNVGIAFKNFFRRVKQGGKPGYPRFTKKGLHDSFRADNGPANAESDAVECVGKTVKLPKCGVVRMRESLRFSGRKLAATVSKQADGWYVAILVDTADCLSGRLDRGIVGVDLGIKELATLSTGEGIASLKPHRAAHRRLVRLSRSLSRKQKGSRNRAKAKTKLATEFDTIAIEDMNVAGMLKNHCLARSIADSGFAEFRRQLTYKATMTGANLVAVDRFFPSSKTCHLCGTIHPMKLSDRVMVCDCGNVMDRDLNAAMNLKNKAASSAVAACGEESSGHSA
jgi:putative transposase